MFATKVSFLGLAMLSAGLLCQAEAELVLCDFARNFTPAHLRTNDATASVVGARDVKFLQVMTGQRDTWPGITLLASGGAWDLTPFAHVLVPLRNTGSNDLRISCRVDNPGANGIEHCVTDALLLRPGASGLLKVELERASSDKLDGKLFGMRGYPVKPGGKGTVVASNITQLLLFVNKPAAPHTFQVGSIRAAGTHLPPTASIADANPFLPFIDTFGQYRHKDWPGKVHSVGELQQRRAGEEQELAKDSGPVEWSRYGGWSDGPQLKATGFFRTEKHRGKWWLVDPEGRLFWSHGIDCVRLMDATPIEERESWFVDFPARSPTSRSSSCRTFTRSRDITPANRPVRFLSQVPISSANTARTGSRRILRSFTAGSAIGD